MSPLFRVAALAIACSLVHKAHAQTYTPVAVSGFNHDIFAEATPSALAGTDTVLDATNHVMYTQGFATAAGITGGVANNGVVTDAGNVRQYQLAPFTGPNALLLMRGVSGALTLTTPAQYSKLSLLTFSTENATSINVSVRFTDNTVSNYLTNYSLSDWFFATTNVVTSGFGRINRVAAAPYGVDGLPSNPRFYYLDISLNCADQQKTVAQVLVSNVTTAGTNAPWPASTVLAVSGQAFTQNASVVTVPATCNASNGTATLTLTGSASPYTISWNTVPVQNGLSATGLAPGSYTATVTNALGCASSVPATVTQTPSSVTVVATAANPTLCNGQGTQLSATPSGGTLATATWTPGGLTGNTISVNPTATTTYTVTGTDNTGCNYNRTVTVTVNQPPVSPATTDATVCAGSTATLSVQNPGAGITYNWYGGFSGGPVLATGSTFTTPPVNSQAVYYVEAVSVAGCVQAVRTSVSAFVTPAPAAAAVNGASLCNGGSSTLSVQAPAAGVTYKWYSAATGGTLLFTGTAYTTPNLSANTTYYVEATGASGCVQATRTPVTVTITTPPPMPAGTATGFCPGAGATFTVINPSLLYTYSWYSAPNAGTLVGTGVNFTSPALNGPTTYYLEATSAPGCINGRTAVTANPFTPQSAPVASVSSTGNGSITFAWTAVAGATGYEVSVNGGAYITPSSGSTGLTHTISGLQPGQSASLTVRALALPSCRNSLASAPVSAVLPGSVLYVPSAFTPNNDGRNDVLLVYGAGVAAIDFRVFDQWGAEVFRSETQSSGWDGTRRGKPQPSGVYMYAVRVTRSDGSEQVLKGSVNLVR